MARKRKRFKHFPKQTSSNSNDFKEKNYKELYLKIKKNKYDMSDTEPIQTNDSLTTSKKKDRILNEDELKALSGMEIMKHFIQRNIHYTVCLKVVKDEFRFGFSRRTETEKRPWSRKLANIISRGRALKNPGIVLNIQDSSKVTFHFAKQLLYGEMKDHTASSLKIDKFFEKQRELKENYRMFETDQAKMFKMRKELIGLRNRYKDEIILPALGLPEMFSSKETLEAQESLIQEA